LLKSLSFQGEKKKKPIHFELLLNEGLPVLDPNY